MVATEEHTITVVQWLCMSLLQQYAADFLVEAGYTDAKPRSTPWGAHFLEDEEPLDKASTEIRNILEDSGAVNAPKYSDRDSVTRVVLSALVSDNQLTHCLVKIRQEVLRNGHYPCASTTA